MGRHIFGAIATVALLIQSVSPATAAERFWFTETQVEFGVTGVLQGTSGNTYIDADGVEVKDQFDYAYTADLAFIGRLTPGQSLNLILETGHGEAANDNFPMRTIPNYDAYALADIVQVSQAYYEGEFMDGALILAFGRMDVASLTDGNEYAGDETSQFLNSLFVRSVGTIFAEHASYYVPTLMISFAPVELISVTYTFSQDHGEDLFGTPQHNIELGLHPSFDNFAANLRVMYGMTDLPHTEIATGTEVSNTGMINVSFDMTIAENFGFFARYAMQDDTLVENEVVLAVSGGISLAGAIWGRDDDNLGVAYGFVGLNETLFPDAGDKETVIEAYYRISINDHFTLSADIQMFSNIERGENRDVTVFGLRTQMDL
jgi:hypothetical protein